MRHWVTRITCIKVMRPMNELHTNRYQQFIIINIGYYFRGLHFHILFLLKTKVLQAVANKIYLNCNVDIWFLLLMGTYVDLGNIMLVLHT